jgi:hypothetical protein
LHLKQTSPLAPAAGRAPHFVSNEICGARTRNAPATCRALNAGSHNPQPFGGNMSIESSHFDDGISFTEEPESSFAAWSIDDLVQSSDLVSLRPAQAFSDDGF